MFLPSQRNLTASVKTLINGKPTSAVLDTAAMVTLVRDDYLTDFKTQGQMGPVCVLTGIGTDPVHGRIMYNVPITLGSQTFLHTVCVVPVKDTCLLGHGFLSATASVLDLGNETLTIGEDVLCQCHHDPRTPIFQDDDRTSYSGTTKFCRLYQD